MAVNESSAPGDVVILEREVADTAVVSSNILVVGWTSGSGDREVLGAEDGGSDDTLTGEAEGTWRLTADSEDISLGTRREWW